MDAFKRFSRVVLAALIVSAAAGCEDDPSKPPPPTPPIPLNLADQYTERSTDPDKRLPDNQVFDILVDSQGRLWVATEAGIAMRPAGSSDLIIFNEFNGIPNRRCRAVTELNGKIFVGTWGGGAAEWDGQSTFTALPIRKGSIAGLVGPQVSSIARDDSSLWIGTTVGLSQYIDRASLPMSQRWKQHNNRLGTGLIVSSVLVHRTVLRGSEVWVGKKGGGITLLRIPTGQSQFTTTSSGIPDMDCNAVAGDPVSGLVWCGFATAGIASVDFDNSVWRHYTEVEGLMSNFIHTVAVRANGDLWIGSQEGATRRKPDGTVTNFPKGSGLPDARVRKIYIDPADRVWLGFVDGGVARVTNPDVTRQP